MNNAIIVRAELGNMRIKASIDERGGADFDSPSPKQVSDETELHFHTLYELFFALSGELVIKDAEGHHSFSDCIVSIPPFAEHTAIKDPSRFRILFELVEIKRAGGGNVYGKMTELLSNGITPLLGNSKIKFCVEEIKRTIKKTGALIREELACLLKLLFLNLYEENTQREGGGGIGMENYLIVIDECINSHLSEDVTIAFVAERLHLSYRQTARIIKANYKEPLYEIINQKRISKAKKLLATTSRPISEIALAVGFSNESYFYKLFHERCGITPKKYREESLKNITISP